MILLSSIIEAFEAEFLAQYQEAILPGHACALSAMKSCRTRLSPRMLAQCRACDEQVFVPHSCGRRNCPHCQHHESQQWLERQLKKQVPASCPLRGASPYFLLTFTLPAEFRALARQHPRSLYELLIRCSWETVQTFSQNDAQLQGTPGAIAVLHTHTRRLDYHPHVHLVMPAAAIDGDHQRWRTKQGAGQKQGQNKRGKGYLFNHKALATVFRAKMLAAITGEGLELPASHPRKWVVDCKCVGTGEKALGEAPRRRLGYLGRYLYRGVIQEKDIVACNNGQVTFRYQNGKKKRTEHRTVPGATFLWLILQHVLPKGFRRARNFGFLHPNSKRLIELLHLLLKFNPSRALAWVRKRPPLTCRCCGAPMHIGRTRIPPMCSGPIPALSGSRG